jgi:hypothetical protein
MIAARCGASVNAGLVSRYGLWVSAAASLGIVSGSVFPEDKLNQIPASAIVIVVFGFGIWLAVVNTLNRCGEGWIADTLFGLFVSAVVLKWGLLVGMMLHGNFG